MWCKTPKWAYNVVSKRYLLNCVCKAAHVQPFHAVQRNALNVVCLALNVMCLALNVVCLAFDPLPRVLHITMPHILVMMCFQLSFTWHSILTGTFRPHHRAACLVRMSCVPVAS